jgi:hypothetical protein
MEVGNTVVVIEEVVGYYVKSCGAQISINVPKRYEGIVLQIRHIEVLVHFTMIPQNTWIPRSKIEVKK